MGKERCTSLLWVHFGANPDGPPPAAPLRSSGAAGIQRGRGSTVAEGCELRPCSLTRGAPRWCLQAELSAFQPQFPRLEWKPREDRDLALVTVTSPEPHRAPGL